MTYIVLAIFIISGFMAFYRCFDIILSELDRPKNVFDPWYDFCKDEIKRKHIQLFFFMALFGISFFILNFLV